MNPSVAIIILNWNNAADTLDCLKSVFELDYPNFNVLIVDNGSTDDSVAQIRERYPDLDILPTGENLGYAGGNNAGIREALESGAEYVWILNDDTTVGRDSLSSLIEAAALHQNVGFAGPLVRLREEPDHILSAGGFFDQGMAPCQRGLGELDTGQYPHPEAVDFLSGCALLASRQVIEAVGLLDGSFFAYGEEVDWCYRGALAGFISLMVPAAIVWHPDTRSRDENSPRVTYYISRNRLLFLHKHRLGSRYLGQTLAQYFYWLVNWSLNPKWKGIGPKRNALWHAMLDFAKGRYGRSVNV